MKKAKWMLVLAVICSVLIFSVNSSHAIATAYSHGDLDWYTLTTAGDATFTPGATTFSVSGYVKTYDVNLSAITPSVLIDPDGFKAAVSLLTPTENVVAAPYVISLIPYVSSGPYDIFGASSNGSNAGAAAKLASYGYYLSADSGSIAAGQPNVVHTYAIAEVRQYFTITSNGTLSFNVGYNIWSGAQVDYTNYPYAEYAFASETVFAKVVKLPSGTNQSEFAEAKTELLGGPDNGTTGKSNTLDVAGLSFKVGDEGYFLGQVISETWAVPEPLSVTLLGLGLFGLGILSRSRKSS
jgi:hypothetical protein